MGRACGGGHKIHPRHGGGCLDRLSAGRRGGGETGAEAGHDDSDECRGMIVGLALREGRRGRRRGKLGERRERGQGSRFGLEFLDDTGGRPRRS